mmetsp:Transcript_11874/g.20629  ORF Transcript_11874/g.20629 Transcript_11874/m.20629 type:complete len:555 (-) Transcript_11874:258-1922(-)|eukprot:CAMPEP_0183729292 /NCGR_PEP_ID=MMETSP0737-20130205/30006_1 /TAXON_ID=385413 /ORGANISM="Thalassiosira miniscula, Strain CCMP1093" /LENGTH=554 /DNA_ID=CAMNT_0025961441 /DNA_START=134 /DNA_END=1798 /DNA_ORIENTATION=+
MTNENENTRLSGVIKVNDSDIICGRGGLALKHPGNMAYRKIVGLNKELYATCLKTEKLRISKSIVAAIREINGRFLEREDGKTSSSLDEKDDNGNPVKWQDIGDKRAVEKTSQALREGQPKLLKKLAQQQENGVLNNGANQMRNFNQGMGVAPQSQFMPQYGQQQPMLNQNGFNQMQGGVQMQSYGMQPHVQNNIHVQQQVQGTNQGRAPTQNILQDQKRPSFTLAALTAQDEPRFNSFPRNSFVENGLARSGSGRQASAHASWHDSWGSSDPAPLRSTLTKRSSMDSHDSWGVEDPVPLPYHEGEDHGAINRQVFSADDQHQLMTCLDVAGSESLQNPGVKRPSVSFQIRPKRQSYGTMSLSSHLSELSVFDDAFDALSLDSGMEAAHREAEFEMLGEFGNDSMSLGTFESPMSGDEKSLLRKSPRRSILKRNFKWSGNPSNTYADPGMIFTSTLDSKPGGVNSGTDVSNMLGERRKSVVAFEVGVERRRSSRLSMCSALTDFSGVLKREFGSTLSIQSADFRELIDDIDSDSEEDNDDEKMNGKVKVGGNSS